MIYFKKLKIAHINAVLVTYLLGAFSCQENVRVQKFALPNDVLQDARTAFIKTDSEGLVKDYAQISSGQVLPEGYTIANPTDAQRIDDLVKSGRKILFVHVYGNAEVREHALRTLASAALRLQAPSNDKVLMYNLNILALNRFIATYKFTDEQARDYYVSVAQRLNDKRLSEKNVVVVDVDLLEHGMRPNMLFEALSKPSIIALSKDSKDTLKLTSGEHKSEEIRLSNLDPGEIFSLTNKRISRSAGFKNDKAAAEKTSLLVAKIVAATDPQDNLGNFNRILRAIRPVIEQAPLSATFETDITNAIANELGLDSNYINNLNIQSQSLATIRTKIKEDPEAYRKQVRQTDEILKRVNLLPDTKNLSLSSNDLAHLENRMRKVVSDSEGSLLTDAEQKRDDLKNALEDAMRLLEQRGQAQIDKAAKDIKNTTARVVKKSEQVIKEEENAQKSALLERMDEKNGNNIETLKRAISLNSQRAGNELKRAIATAKNELGRALDSAKNQINTNTNEGFKQSEEQEQMLSDALRHAAERAEHKGHGALKGATERINATAHVLAQKTNQSWSNLETALEKLSELQLNTSSDAIEKAKKAIANDTKAIVESVVKRVNDNTQGVVVKAEQRITSQTGLMSDGIDKRIADTGAELGQKIAKLPSQANNKKQLGEALGRVNDLTKMEVGRASERIIDNNEANKQEQKAAMDALRETLVLRIKEAVARVVLRVKEQNKTINDHTQSKVQQAQRSLEENIEEAKQQIDEVIREIGAHNLQQMQKLANEDRLYWQRLLLAHLYESLLGVEIINAPAEVRRKFQFTAGRPAVRSTDFHKQYDSTNANTKRRFERDLTRYVIQRMGI